MDAAVLQIVIHRIIIACICLIFFFFQAEDGIRDIGVTGVQTCALPIYDPHELRLTESWLNWLKDVDGNIFEVGVSRRAPLGELFEGAANSLYNMFQLLHGQFSRYRFDDALGQLRNFGLHVEPRPHHRPSFRRATRYRSGCRYRRGSGFVSGYAFSSPSSQ